MLTTSSAPPQSSTSKVTIEGDKQQDASDIESFLLDRQTFKSFMMNATGVARYLQFLGLERNDNALRLYLSALQLRKLTGRAVSLTRDFDAEYLSPSATSPVDLPADLHDAARLQTLKILDSLDPDALYTRLVDHLADRLLAESYPRFVKHQILRYTQAQLAADRAFLETERQHPRKLKGLGDCFLLTDPRQPDTPIVLASDGFKEVTGYDRLEINRNCRFLQGPRTSISATQRVRQAVHEQTEHTELLVNHRKDGSAFWNLLHMIPLPNDDGRVDFIFGAQIDVSELVNAKRGNYDLLVDETQVSHGQDQDPSFLGKVSVIRKILSSFKGGSAAPAKEVTQQVGLAVGVSQAAGVYMTPQSSSGNIADRTGSGSSVASSGKSGESQQSSTSNKPGDSFLRVASTITAVSDLFVATYSRVVIFDASQNPGDERSYKIRYTTDGFTRAMGYDQKAARGALLVSVLFGKQTPASSYKRLRRTVERVDSATFETVLNTATGTTVYARLNLTPLKSTSDPSNAAVLWVAVIADSVAGPAAATAAQTVPPGLASSTNTGANLQHDQAVSVLETAL
ncbi:hypothetical protein RI367_005537 [Sorochytrium milnesiophthora]